MMDDYSMTTDRFVKAALEGQWLAALVQLQDASDAMTLEATDEGNLTQTGEDGLRRLAEILFRYFPMNPVLYISGTPAQVLAELFQQLGMELKLHPRTGPEGIALYTELGYLAEMFLSGEGFE